MDSGWEGYDSERIQHWSFFSRVVHPSVEDLSEHQSKFEKRKRLGIRGRNFRQRPKSMSLEMISKYIHVIKCRAWGPGLIDWSIDWMAMNSLVVFAAACYPISSTSLHQEVLNNNMKDSRGKAVPVQITLFGFFFHIATSLSSSSLGLREATKIKMTHICWINMSH